jgi:hypothetical protein|tara:strand:- start:1908 stop:2501 length:594 start_codon:yes stop_codon:yes gene_type:complete
LFQISYNILRKLFSILFLIVLFLNSTAQVKGFTAQLNGELGFDIKPFFLNEYEISDVSTYGISGSANFFQPILSTDFAVNLGIGIRVYQMNAKTALTELSGQVVLPTLNVGFNYTLLTKHQIQFGINTTANADIKDFRSQMSDLFRYNFMIYYQYNFNDKFSGMIGYERIIYPNQDIYVIENPRYLISTGIQYNFWK